MRTVRAYDVAALAAVIALAGFTARTEAQETSASTGVDILRLDAIQVVQDAGGTVPLLTGRKVLLRAYVFPQAVSGRLKGTAVVTDAHGNAHELVSTNEVDAAAVAGMLNAQMEASLESTLNFVIPAEVLATPGSISYVVRSVTAGDDAVRCTNCGALMRWHPVVKAPPMTVRLVGLRYPYRSPQGVLRAEPRERDVALTKSWLSRTLPADLTFEYGVMESEHAARFTCSQANLQLDKARIDDELANGRPSSKRYYALVADEGFAMRGCAPSTGARVASGPAGSRDVLQMGESDGSYADWYAAHEIGHLLGRRHVSGCGEDPPHDRRFPSPVGSIAPGIGYDWGDPNDPLLPPRLILGDAGYDMMTYCRQPWPSAYSFTRILQRLQMESQPVLSGLIVDDGDGEYEDQEQPGFPLDSDSMLTILATINTTRGTGTIEFIRVLDGGFQEMLAGPDSSFASLSFRDAGQQEIARVPLLFSLPTDHEEGSDQVGTARGTMPLPRRTHSVALMMRDRELHAITRSPSPPRVTQLASPSGGYDAQSESFVLRWRGGDPDGRTALKYSVQLSQDNGATWNTIAVGLTRSELEISREAIAAPESTRVRILASDGFLTTATEWPLPRRQ